MGIPVKLEAFVGPLDLLLHLIEKNKIDIYDIPIVEITDQYMEYIHAAENRNMDVMSEFLVMAATLLRIKSQMLLPIDETLPEEEQDPRRELMERLLEYKMYRYMASELRDRQVDAKKLFYKTPDIPEEVAAYKEEIKPEELLEGLTLTKLQDVFRSVIHRQVEKVDPIRSKFGEIHKEEINLEERVREIEHYGACHKTFSFRRVLSGAAGRMAVIVTFLAVLELMKMGRLKAVQEELFEDIRLTYLQNAQQQDDYKLTDY